jgi:UDP-N-acetylglucosamine--N-acetylmuramyl-(pentapeptide) pyrophosphoryl-undecaprenol N-acetylglucosamine transferase
VERVYIGQNFKIDLVGGAIRSMKTYFYVGAGSGGHITPLIAVARRVKQLAPDSKHIYVGFIGDKFGDFIANANIFDEVAYINAGKLRRYHKSGLKSLIDIPTMLKNIRDVGRIFTGYFQSVRLIKKYHPTAIFIKGGFVGVPVGFAARRKGVPYMTHDSDAIPGLANRLIAKHAKHHAVALPVENYSYKKEQTTNTGIPVRGDFIPANKARSAELRYKYHIEPNAKVVLVTGGGLGAKRLNFAVSNQAKDFLSNKNHFLIHITGKGSYDKVQSSYRKLLPESSHKNLILLDLTDDIHELSAVSDLIITRAGATSLAEFAMQRKACIVVPNPYLTSGHQLKNAKIWQDNKAVVVVEESNLASLMDVASNLIINNKKLDELATNLNRLARPDAASVIASILINLNEASKR